MNRRGGKWSRIWEGGFYRRWFRFNMLLGSFCEENSFGPAPERQEAAKRSSELKVKGGFVAVQGVEFRGGFEGQDGSHGRIGGVGKMTGHGFIQGDGLCLDDLKHSPMGHGHGVDQLGFGDIAGAVAGHETGAEFDEGCGGIMVERWVRRGEAVAGAVAGGVALALGGDGSSRTGAVGAGGGDLCWGAHFIVSIGWGWRRGRSSEWQIAQGERDTGRGRRGLAHPGKCPSASVWLFPGT